jgi:tetratricopeptide (TPR) repeat protein
MGVVYRARDRALGRDVAVKLLADCFHAGSPAARRFLVEARITGQLQHPGIPAIHQVGALPDGRPFLAMKLIKGRTLDELLRARPGPSADRGRFVAIFEQVCQAVAYAHARRVVHRDLKPANVMVGAFGEVQVMDWGLAKVLAGGGRRPRGATESHEPTHGTKTSSTDSEDVATQAGSVLGSPAYMPPEQAVGAVDQVDARSDVFGLGGVLCAILTGRPPYVGDSPESTRRLAAQAKLDDAFALLDGCAAEPGLAALCRRCLAAERADRPIDAGAVAKAVADLRAAAEDRARKAELDRARAEAEAREQRRRRRTQVALAAAVGLLLTGGGAFAWWQDKLNRDQKTVALREQLEDERRQAAERERLARNGDAIAGLVGQCEKALQADDADLAAASLDQIDRRLPEGGGEALTDRVARCRADLSVLRELDDVDTFRWSPIENVQVTRYPDDKAVAGRWRAAFASYGALPGETPTAEVAARVAGAAVRDRLLAALDSWLIAEPDPGLRAVLRAVDPDPYRDDVRDAIAAGDRERVTALAAQSAALSQPPGFAAALGQHPTVPVGRRRAVLEAGLSPRPGDLNLLMALGTSYSNQTTKGQEDRLRWYHAAVAAHPRCAVAHYNLGVAMGGKNADGAIAAYKEAIRLNPNYGEVYTHLWFTLSARGGVDEAAAGLREAVRLYPRSAPAHYTLGRILHEYKRDLDAAAVHFREAAQLDPTNFRPHSSLGRIRQDKGDLHGAVAAFREAVRLQPTGYPSLHQAHQHALARLLATGPDGVRDGRQAVEHATRACELSGWKEPAAIATLAAAYAEAGDFDKAVEFQTKALAFPKYEKKDGAEGRKRLDLYARKQPYRDPASAPHEVAPPPRAKGDWDGAIASHREANHLDLKRASDPNTLGDAQRARQNPDEGARKPNHSSPESARYHTTRGDALLAKGDRDGAIASYREAIKFDPNYAAARIKLGNNLLVKDDLDGAIAIFREAIRHNPRFASYHYALGYVLRAKGDLSGAVASFKEAVRLGANLPAYASLASLLATGPDGVRNGKLAVEYATRACELNGWKGPGSLATLAAAYAAAGDFDKAVEFQTKALSLPASEKNVAEARQRLELYTRKQPYRDPTLARANPSGDPRAKKNPRSSTSHREAYRHDPKDAPAHYELGNFLRSNGDLGQAIAAYREAIRLDPKHGSAHYYLGGALRDEGDLNGAVAAYREATRLTPNNAHFQHDLARLLAVGPDGVRDGRRAVEYATRACAISRMKIPDYIDTLAAAYAEAGDFEKAVEFQTKALSAPAFEKTNGAEARRRLDLYKQRTPYRDPALIPREVAPPPRPAM